MLGDRDPRDDLFDILFCHLVLCAEIWSPEEKLLEVCTFQLHMILEKVLSRKGTGNKRLLWKDGIQLLSRCGLFHLAIWVQGGFAAERWGGDAYEVPPYLVQFYPLLWDPRLWVLQAEDPELGLHQVGGVLLHRRDVKSDDSEVKAVIARWDGICKKVVWFYYFSNDKINCSFKQYNTRQPQWGVYL